MSCRPSCAKCCATSSCPACSTPSRSGSPWPARLDATMTLEGWDESTDAVYARALWAELCTLRFVDERRDLIIMGPVGVGKTFMASALGHIACRRRHTTLMARADQL